MKANITVEELVQQQPCKPMNEDTIDAIIKKMAITEPIEVLLAQLNS